MKRTLNIYVEEKFTRDKKPYLTYTFRKLKANNEYEYFRVVFKRNKDKPDGKGMYTITLDDENLSILSKNNDYKQRGIYIQEIISCEKKELSEQEKIEIHNNQMKELFD